MSLGDILAGLAIHLLVLNCLSEIENHKTFANKAIEKISLRGEYEFLKDYCANEYNLRKKQLIQCSTSILWKEKGQFVDVCTSLTLHKTYPTRWYKIELQCLFNSTSGNGSLQILSNSINIKR